MDKEISQEEKDYYSEARRVIHRLGNAFIVLAVVAAFALLAVAGGFLWAEGSLVPDAAKMVALEKNGGEINCELTNCHLGNSSIEYSFNIYYAWNPENPLPDVSFVDRYSQVCKHVSCALSARKVEP